MPKYRIIPVGGGGITPEGTLEIRSEGVFDVTDYASVDVDIFDDTTTKTITNNGTYNASDDNVLGYSQVTVDVPASAVDSGTKQITANGNGQDVVGYAFVDVNVQPNLQTKSNIDPTTSSQTITADQNYDGLSSVQINAVTASVDANITAGNIKNGVSILGVTGSYTGEGIIPTGTIQISRNGIIDVTQYASADVNVASSDTDFFCIEANAASTIQLKPYGGYIFYYSSDKTNWSEASANTTLNLDQGDKVYFYGNKAPGITYSNTGEKTKITISSGNVSLSGSLNTLSDSVASQYPVANGFVYLFEDSVATIDASAITLPRYTADYCYDSMFKGCVGLIKAPNLPATEIKQNCYNSMFYGCTSLTKAPALPATDLLVATGCYKQMFYGCTSLTQAPDLPATQLGQQCYDSMFSGCTALTTAPALPATVLSNNCYNSMFYGCTSLTKAPALPATSISNSESYCYSGMFQECTSLTESPDLTHIDTISSNAMSNMFNGCVNMSKLYIPNVSTWNTSYTSNWVKNVASTGTVFIVNEDATIPVGESGIPSGWTTIVAPTISVDYTNMEITVSTDVVGADLYYSVNDTDTPAQFTQYTGPISIPSGSNYYKVRAYLIDSGVMSPISSNSYNNYFYIEAAGSTNVTITFQRDSYPEYPKQNTEFSFDRITWSRVNSVSYISVPNGDKVYFRRNITNSASHYGIFANGDTAIKIGNSQGKVGGCISSLLFKTTDPNNTDIKSKALGNLFYNSTTIIDAQNLIIDISNLPNQSLSNAFNRCTSLTTAPDLSNVTSIDSAGMTNCFCDCTSLTTAPDLSNLTSIGNSGMDNCFGGCTSLTTAPDLSNLTSIGHNGMRRCFYNCKFTTAPDLSNVTSIDLYGLSYCFYYCSLLTSITAPNVSSWDGIVFSNWVDCVAASGTLYAPTGVTIPTGVSGIPYGWTRVDY